MTYKFTIKSIQEFTTSDLIDILSSCIEGGCNYWCRIGNDTLEYRAVSYHLHENAKDGAVICIEDIMVYMMEHRIPIEMWEDEEDDGSFSKKHLLTLDKFLKGIQKAIDEGCWDGTDTCDVDGVVGDCIMQYALLDDLIYG